MTKWYYYCYFVWLLAALLLLVSCKDNLHDVDGFQEEDKIIQACKSNGKGVRNLWCRYTLPSQPDWELCTMERYQHTATIPCSQWSVIKDMQMPLRQDAQKESI